MDLKYGYFGFSLAQVWISVFLIRSGNWPASLLTIALGVFAFICYVGEVGS